MLFKTKLLISLSSVGVAGGTGAGVYYGINKSKDDGTKNSDTTTKQNAQPVLNPPAPESERQVVNP